MFVRTIQEDDMTREDTMTAAILGELIPELEYAAPLLLERSDRGDPLVGTTSPTDPGFETGAVDSVLLEFFKSLVPYVRTVLSWGMLRVIQAWFSSQRESRQQAELLAMLNVLLAENARLRQTVERIAELLGRREGAPVSAEDVLRSFAAAMSRISSTDTGHEPA
jgi:hypothetical protein